MDAFAYIYSAWRKKTTRFLWMARIITLYKLGPDGFPCPPMRHVRDLVAPAGTPGRKRGAPALRHARRNNAVLAAREVQLRNARCRHGLIHGIQGAVQWRKVQARRPEAVIQVAGYGAKKDGILPALSQQGGDAASSGKAVQGDPCRPGAQLGLIDGGGSAAYRAFAHAIRSPDSLRTPLCIGIFHILAGAS